MLSVGGGGNGTAARGLGMGFGGAVGSMEDTELEEGESCYGRDGDADDATVDPDIALSYLDEKLEHVLGHFQKDFEGGVSAENLGTKFGVYGSFLPTYQRSPMCGHRRSPGSVQNPTAKRSPYNPVQEVVHPSPKGPTNAISFSRRSFPPSSNSLGKRESFPPVALSPQHELTNKPFNSSDQKTLKVRIKLGPDNASARNNAAIYSGLGLDISPSSSPDDSPEVNGEIMPELCDSPNESPTIIIQIMTTFPILGGSMLSPLTDSLLCLLEKEKYSSKDGETVAVLRSSFETSVVPEACSPMRKEKNSNLKKLKPVEKTGPYALMDLSSKNGENDMVSPLKKDTNEKTERQKIGETAWNFNRASDSIRQSNKVVVKDQMTSPVSIKDEMLEAVGIVDVSDRPVRNVPLCKGTKNSKPSLVEKEWEEKKTSTYKDLLSDPEKEDRNRVDRNCDVLKTNSEGFNNKYQTNALIESVKQKTNDPLYVGKKKVKGSHFSGNALMEFSKEGSMAGGEVLKDKKTGHVQSCPSENMSEFSKAQRESYGNPDKEHGDFPGGIKTEQVENRVGLLEGSFKNKAKDPQLGIEKETLPFSEKPKERVGGKGKVSLTAEVCGKVSIEASNLGVDPLTGMAILPTCPVVIEENWVQCENCNKWRLLPFGSKTESLPKKWLCSMLDWLPGMNSCSVSEEETTKALNALYQIPLPESQTTIHGASGITLADGGNLDQLQPSLHPVPVVAKKKSGSKDLSIAPSQNQLPNSVKKSQPVPLKCRSLNDVNQHPPYSISSSKDASQQSSKSNDLFVGKCGHKSKDKHKSLGHFSDGGNITGSSKQSKSKSKWETEQESMRASKKIRLDGLHHADENWHSENGITGKVFLNSCNGLQAKVNGENIQKFNEKSSAKGFIEGESRDDSLPTGKKMRAQYQVTSNGVIEVSEMGKTDKMDLAARKRKVKEFKSDQVYPETFLGNGHLPDAMSFEKVEIKEIESRKEKKSRLSKTDHKEAKASKADGRKDKKGRVNKILLSDSRGLFLDGTGIEKRDCAENELQMEKDQSNDVSQRTMDGLDPLRRDLGYGASLTAATSSSSKVSGSYKSKGNFQEVRGSPVESVSSSPLRISNADKITSKGNLFVKDEPTVAFSTAESPKRLSDGEAEGGSDQSKTSKAKAASIVLRETMNGEAVLSSFGGALHYQDMDTNQISNTKAREEVCLQACSGTHGIHYPPEFPNVNVENSGGKTSGQITQHEHDGTKNCLSQAKRDGYHVNESSQLNSKSNCLRSKDRHKSVKPDVESGRVKASDSFGGHEDNYFSKNANGFRCGSDMESRGCFPYHEEMREKSSNIPVKDQKNYLGKKITVGNTLSEGGKDGLPIVGTHEDSLQGSPLLTKQYSNFTYAKDLKNVPESLHQVSIREDENSVKDLLLDRAGEAELAPGRGKSQPLAHSGDKQEKQNQGSRVTPAPCNGSKSEVLPSCLVNGDASRLPKKQRYPDNQSGSHQGSLKQPMPNGVCNRDIDAPSPVRKDGGHSAATVVLKEARDLKHSANRLKSRGLEHESTGLYFQAALKFLYVASLLETSSAENGRHGETQSIQMYSETARLCNFCAHEYEKCKEMASAALAYKCTEVAYMKVVYSKQTSASKDYHELQATLIMAQPGESPSSSASDVDNLNHLSASDKAARAKGTAFPHVGGNIVFAARNRPNFRRLFNFTQDVNSAMEASRKSYSAFAAANSNFREVRYGLEGKTSVRRVLDFNFHDVEGLLRLVRLAMEAISH